MGFSNNIKGSLKRGYYFLCDPRPVSIAGTTAYFDFHPDRGGDILRWRLNSENYLIKDLINEAKPSDIIWDIGAGIGHFACFAVLAASNGRVITFEPYPPNIPQLSRNLLHNGQNHSILGLALSDDPGVAQLSLADEPTTGYGSGSIIEDGTSTLPVSQATGDCLVSDSVAPAPAIIKVDVEGAEEQVITGMEELLQGESCRVVYCELHSLSSSGLSLETYQELMASFGFTTSIMNRRKYDEKLKQIHAKSIK